jgi:hypothetical protein
MNVVLLGIGAFLVSVRRSISLDRESAQVLLTKTTLINRRVLRLAFADITHCKVGVDQVYSGAGVAGSTMGQSYFPVHSLRLVLTGGETVLLDRGSERRMDSLGEKLSRFLERPLVKDT